MGASRPEARPHQLVEFRTPGSRFPTDCEQGVVDRRIGTTKCGQ
jgi:hypothetical protein